MTIDPASAIASKTVQVALIFAGIGCALIAFDTVMGIALDYKVRYVPEVVAMLTAMFTGIAAKNAGDNFISYRRDVAASSTVYSGPANVQ